MHDDTDLFSPFAAGAMQLSNRIAMAPLTRARCRSDGVPTDQAVVYYRQRASAGLIIAEATAVAANAPGAVDVPGLFCPEHVRGWRRVTDAVHEQGGRIFAQLWHAGRMSHSSLNPTGATPIAPSALLPDALTFTREGFVPCEMPREIRTEEIPDLVDQYRRASANAASAGFDGVELHAAHGYLPDTFLRDSSNKRNDAYGGSIENRARFVLEVLDALSQSFGPERVAVRISPNTSAGDVKDSDPAALFGYLIEQMNALRIGWLDIVEGENLVSRHVEGGIDTTLLATMFNGTVMVNHGYDLKSAINTRRAGHADMVMFGRLFLSNPDLVERLRDGLPLAGVPDKEFWYGGSEKGYTDFPPYKMNGQS